MAPRSASIEIDREQRRLFAQLDVAFFAQFARQGAHQRLADFDAAAGQMPAVDVAVLDQKNAAGAVDHQAAHAERQPAGEAPIDVQQPPRRRLDGPAQRLKLHEQTMIR